MERPPEKLSKYLDYGDWDLLGEIIRNPKTVFVYDADGIIVDSPGKVFQLFTQKTNVPVFPRDIDRWDFLTYKAIQNGLGESVIKDAEKDWYDPDVLESSPRVYYSKPAVYWTMHSHGPENNYILTSRLPKLKEATEKWFAKHFPKIPEENILIRNPGDQTSPSQFKVKEMSKLAENAEWVVLAEDSTKYTKTVLDNGPSNCVVIYIPSGLIRPDFIHSRMFIVNRYPIESQGVYPLMQIIKRSLSGKNIS